MSSDYIWLPALFVAVIPELLLFISPFKIFLIMILGSPLLSNTTTTLKSQWWYSQYPASQCLDLISSIDFCLSCYLKSVTSLVISQTHYSCLLNSSIILMSHIFLVIPLVPQFQHIFKLYPDLQFFYLTMSLPFIHLLSFPFSHIQSLYIHSLECTLNSFAFPSPLYLDIIPWLKPKCWLNRTMSILCPYPSS